MPLGGASLAVLRARHRLEVGGGDRLRHAGQRDPRARLFVPQEGEGLLLSGVLVPGRGHPLKRGHAPGDGSGDVRPNDGGSGTPHGDDQQADEAASDA